MSKRASGVVEVSVLGTSSGIVYAIWFYDPSLRQPLLGALILRQLEMLGQEGGERKSLEGGVGLGRKEGFRTVPTGRW